MRRVLRRSESRRLARACASVVDNWAQASTARHYQARHKDLRKMVIQGARAALPALSRSSTALGQWLRGLLARAHSNT